MGLYLYIIPPFSIYCMFWSSCRVICLVAFCFKKASVCMMQHKYSIWLLSLCRSKTFNPETQGRGKKPNQTQLNFFPTPSTLANRQIWKIIIGKILQNFPKPLGLMWLAVCGLDVTSVFIGGTQDLLFSTLVERRY